MTQFKFEAIGTSWKIDIYDGLSKSTEAKVLSRVMARIEIFDKAYSRFREDSLITEMSRKKGTYRLPDDAEQIMSLYHDLYILTDGLVTPLIGNLISDAGYDAKYSLHQKGELKPAPKWEEALEYSHPNLVIKQPAILDFGAAGKGYLIDIISEVLETEGISGYCIDAGGDILHRNKAPDAEPIRVGLENPENTDQVVGVYSLQNASICGSAGNRRKWGDFTHIINPKTLTSPKDILAVWVVAKTALLADALATCLFFVPADRLAQKYDFQYFLIRSDRSFEKSAGFSAEIFS